MVDSSKIKTRRKRCVVDRITSLSLCYDCIGFLISYVHMLRVLNKLETCTIVCLYLEVYLPEHTDISHRAWYPGALCLGSIYHQLGKTGHQQPSKKEST